MDPEELQEVMALEEMLVIQEHQDLEEQWD